MPLACFAYPFPDFKVCCPTELLNCFWIDDPRMTRREVRPDLPELPPPTQRGRSLTPRQSCDDVTTTTQLRLTGLHAGPQRSVRGCCATINFGTCRINALMLMRMCGHGRVRIASGEDDNHFARCAALTDMSKRGGNLVEREGTVDVDPDLPGNA